MIEISLYNNGVEVKGHAIPHICSEVSILTWNLANTLSHYIIDEKSEYYSSINDNPDNPNEGYTQLTLDVENKKSIEAYETYRHNLKTWAKAMWHPNVVRIRGFDEDLMGKND